MGVETREEHPTTAEAANPERLGGAATAGVLLAGWATAGACFALGERDAASAVALVFGLAWWIAAVAIVRSDLADYLIPDGASAATAVLGLGETAATSVVSGLGLGDTALALAASLALGLGAALLFWGVAELFRRFGRGEALGFGDVKLAGALAIWLTPGDAALALEIAALGAIAAVFAMRRGALRSTAVPFGAFMAPAAWLVFVAAPLWDRLP